MKKKIILLILLFSFFAGCSAYKTLANLSYVKFRIKDVTRFSILGIDISNKSGLKDLDFTQIAKLTTAAALEHLPVSFTINIEAKNSNKNSYETTDLSIDSFPFELYYNEKQIMKGDIDRPIFIPGKNDVTTFPLNVSLDVLEVFDNLSLDEIAGIIFELGGKNKNPRALKIHAEPSLKLPGGFVYKQSVTIDSETFR